MSRSLPQTDAEKPKRSFRWPPGIPQLVALVLVLLVDSLVANHFFDIVVQNGRLFGSPIDILNRAAPVALLAIGMTLVIATGGIDLSVGAVMAIAGATAATATGIEFGHGQRPIVARGASVAPGVAGETLRARMLENSSMKDSIWIATRSMSRANRL